MSMKKGRSTEKDRIWHNKLKVRKQEEYRSGRIFGLEEKTRNIRLIGLVNEEEEHGHDRIKKEEVITTRP